MYTVNTGDTIYVNVTMISTTSGIVLVQPYKTLETGPTNRWHSDVINESTGLAIVVTITNGPGTLCGASAEWVLKNLSPGDADEAYLYQRQYNSARLRSTLPLATSMSSAPLG